MPTRLDPATVKVHVVLEGATISVALFMKPAHSKSAFGSTFSGGSAVRKSARMSSISDV